MVKGERRPYWQFNELHIVLGLIMHAKTGQIQSDFISVKVHRAI